MAEAAEQQAAVCKDAQDRWRPSNESTSVSHDSHHLCLMAKKSKKKTNKKEQAKEIAQIDDQLESDIEIENSYTLDHVSSKDKLILMKLVKKNDELEEENEKQEQSLQRQEMFLISKLEELKKIKERYEKLSIEHALVTNSSSNVSQLEKENFELKERLDELSNKDIQVRQQKEREARRKDTQTLKQIAARLELEPSRSPLSDEAASEPETEEQQQARYDRQFVEFFQRQ
ncbi:uncharacterized protein [Miscanthus floridulus]|uniref:uncharacterized protein n=1 Tax=Miscanthus floridulus TaxID=154761 RepID=UPI003457FA3E